MVARPCAEREPTAHVRVGQSVRPLAEDREGGRAPDDARHERGGEGDTSRADVDDDRVGPLLDDDPAQAPAALQVELVRARG